MNMDSFSQKQYYSIMIKGIDYIGVGAGAIIFNNNDELFLAKRGNEARNEKHRWEFPGGSVEFGETLADTLRREIFEEYGFIIEVVRLLDVVDHILPEEKQHWVSPTFLCQYKNGIPSIREPHKCEAIGWFRLDSIPVEDLASASRMSLESLKRYLSTSISSRAVLAP
jgi:mutator protein MutT